MICEPPSGEDDRLEISGNPQGAAEPDRDGMHKTYELYLHGDDGTPRFEALTCRTEQELMSAVRRILAETGAHAVDVMEFGQLIFTLTA